MKMWHYAVVGLLLLANTGCRTDPNIAILERELRRKEDEIYRLKWAMEDLQDTSSCSDNWRDNASSDRGVASSRNDGSGPPSGVNPPSVELPGRATEGVPDALKPPPGSSMPNIPEVPEHLRGPSSPGSGGPAFERQTDFPPARNGNNASADIAMNLTPVIPTGDSRDVRKIVLNRIMTGGVSADGGPGDFGLLAVIEPRGADGRTVDAPAEMTVVLLDPTVADADGKALRIARWDYSTVEIAEQFRRGGSSQAIHLMMGLPERRSKHNKLRLFVRYVTSDGRTLQDDMPIELIPAGEPSSRWSPGATNRIGVADNELAPRAPRMARRERPSTPKRPVWSPNRPQ